MPPPEVPPAPPASLTAALVALGVGQGHRVGVLTGRTPLHVAAHAASRAVDAVLVPLDPGAPRAQVLADAAEVAPDVWLLETRHAPLVPDLGAPCIVAAPDGTVTATHGAGTHGPRPGGRGEAGDPVRVLVATSGTTGRKRWVPVTEAQLAHHAEAAAKRLRSGRDARWLCVLPLHHIGGIALLDRCLRGHGSVVLDHRTDGPGLVGALGMGITHVSLVPTHLRRLLDHGGAPPAMLRCVLVGGDRTDSDLIREALAAGWPVFATYGLTEACSQVATATPDELREDPTTVGKPLDGVQVLVAPLEGGTSGGDDAAATDGPLPDGTMGEIVVAGPTVTDPPLRTGDLGWMAARRLHIAGRADDRIVSGGENVDPRRVEAVLEAHPFVRAACVVGRPDAQWGGRVEALLELDPDAAHRFDVGVLQEHVAARLARHERPRRFHVVSALPRTSGGKLRRAQALRSIQEGPAPS